MYQVNYLLSRLQNASRNITFENQTNLFQIIDSSDGTVLDSTIDAYFISYASGLITNFSLNDNNQVLLSSAEIQTYIGARMYYYNPASLDSIMLTTLSPQLWFDFTDRRIFGNFSTNYKVESMLSKYSSNTLSYIFSQVNTNQQAYYTLTALSSYIFPSLRTTVNDQYYTLSSYPSNIFTKFNSAFALSVNVMSYLFFTIGDVFVIYDSVSNARIQFQLGIYGRDTAYRVYITDGLGVSQSIFQAITVSSNSFYRFIFNFTATSLTVSVNDVEYTHTLNTFSQTPTFDAITLFKYTSASVSCTCNIFDALIFNNTLSESSVSQLNEFFKTKYFLLT